MKRAAMLGVFIAATLGGTGAGWATAHHHRHGQRHRHLRPHVAVGDARPYASRILPVPTCRYADGTPYDPDIIGGLNHVGDGGPAANLGGFDPCGD